MIKSLSIAAATLGLCTAAPALAQETVEASQLAARVDHPTCTRGELKALTAAYVAGQKAGDISALPLAANAHFLENMQTVARADGLWNTALPIANVMSLHDEVRCKTFTEIIVTEGDHQYVIGTRLYAHEGEVIRVDSLVTDEGDWLFNANAYLHYAQAEDWTPLHPYQRTDPREMIRGANAYFDAFADKFTDIPFGIPCARLEGGAYTNRTADPEASCEVGIPTGVMYIVNRDFLIDQEMGVINVFCRFGDQRTGMADSHSFRYIDGKFRLIHTVSVNMNDAPSPQANDDGSVGSSG